MQFSLIIAVRNDAPALEQHLKTWCDWFDEVIVVDNHSTDHTQEILAQFPAKKLRPPPAASRAHCYNLGAQHAQSDCLLFWHADCDMPQSSFAAFKRAWQTQQPDYSCFRIEFKAEPFWYRCLESISNFRSRSLRIVYGDQGLCVKKTVFEVVGGYPEEFLLEDLKINKKLKLYRFHFINQPIYPSIRKFIKLGFFNYLLLMNQIIILNWLGVNSKTLHGMYYSSTTKKPGSARQ